MAEMRHPGRRKLPGGWRLKPAKYYEAKRAIKQAFRVQVEDDGFALVEVYHLSNQLGWIGGALQWVEDNMIPYYPLGEFKVSGEVK